MEKEFIPYEQALALKELGFDEPCFAFYLAGAIRYKEYKDSQNKNSAFYNNTVASIPLYQQAFRWFREKYKELKFFIKEEDFRDGLYEYDIKDILGVSGFKTYEDAELECLKKLIEIVKK